MVFVNGGKGGGTFIEFSGGKERRIISVPMFGAEAFLYVREFEYDSLKGIRREYEYESRKNFKKNRNSFLSELNTFESLTQLKETKEFGMIVRPKNRRLRKVLERIDSLIDKEISLPGSWRRVSNSGNDSDTAFVFNEEKLGMPLTSLYFPFIGKYVRWKEIKPSYDSAGNYILQLTDLDGIKWKGVFHRIEGKIVGFIKFDQDNEPEFRAEFIQSGDSVKTMRVYEKDKLSFEKVKMRVSKMHTKELEYRDGDIFVTDFYSDEKGLIRWEVASKKGCEITYVISKCH